jgi:hypothetical protein
MAIWLETDSALFSRAMARPNNLNKVPPRPYSPDDIKARLIEAAERERLDDRSPAQRWLGDPPRHLSALAQRRPPAARETAAAPSVPRVKRG